MNSKQINEHMELKKEEFKNDLNSALKNLSEKKKEFEAATEWVNLLKDIVSKLNKQTITKKPKKKKPIVPKLNSKLEPKPESISDKNNLFQNDSRKNN